MRRIMLPVTVLCAAMISTVAMADALTQIIQRDLVTLGYEPGNTDGEATVATAVAISKFQAEHDLEVTGEASPQLAGIIKAALNGNSPATATVATASAAPTAPEPAVQPAGDALVALQAAQQTCLQQKMAEAQESQQRRRGLARLARAVGRTAGRLGGSEISSDIAALSSDVYTAGAIASDFKGAAEDLGLTESDLEACRNPS
jgi:peptidoglycan hydrolase-like protein with peptidoglycan-binding domain